MQPLDTSKPVRFQNVLLATDFSAASQSALLHALGLARRWNARIFVAHVINPTTIFGQDAVQRAVNDAWRQAHTEMTNQLIAGRLQHIENHVVVRQGEIWPELERMVNEFHADLLVTGTRGRSGMWKMLLGSTAEKIYRYSPIPVMTVGPKAPADAPLEGPKRILYSTGFAPQSLYAGGYALSLAEQLQARLALVHVIQDAPPEANRGQLQSEAKAKLAGLVPSGMPLSYDPELFVQFGEASDAILELSEQWHPQLMVLGIRRQPKNAKRITWATAYNVVANAPCPVLTIKAPKGME